MAAGFRIFASPSLVQSTSTASWAIERQTMCRYVLKAIRRSFGKPGALAL